MRITTQSSPDCAVSPRVAGLANRQLSAGKTYKLVAAGNGTGFNGRYGDYTGEVFLAGQSYAAIRESTGRVDRMTHLASGRIFDIDQHYTGNAWKETGAHVCLTEAASGNG